ncbi:MAG TPA: hypothetical protein VLC06_27230 [Polyangia bacterium]|jgi:hypothetical protein|nr:hypothetical protein [Polyangia bacterium]
MRIRTTRKVSLFPWIPLVPMTLMVGSFVTAVRALLRVRRLEHRLAA